MTPAPTEAPAALADPLAAAPGLDPDDALAAALLAIDPSGLGGAALRGPPDPVRSAWLEHLHRLMPPGAPLRRLPLHASDSALLGGLDLPATLAQGRPVVLPGLLAQADGGLLLLAMAERITAGVAARIAAVMDRQAVQLEREGVAQLRPARLAVLALDEGESDEERLPEALLDRLAFRLRLAPARSGHDAPPAVDWNPGEIAEARRRLPGVRASETVLRSLCATALVLGVDSLRGPLLALRAARAAAALAGAPEVEDEHAALAARLVLAPRATRLPPAADAAPEESPTAPEPPDGPDPTADAAEPPAPAPEPETEPEAEDRADSAPPEPDADPKALAEAMQEMLVEAAQSALAPGLLAALKAGQAQRSRQGAAGRAGAVQKNQPRGRPTGVRRGEPRSGARLNLLATLRAAAPWQKLRQRPEAGLRPPPPPVPHRAAGPAPLQPLQPRRIEVRRDDFHVTRYRQSRATTTVFVVDASGSSALHRLAESKGAVELLLADCYVRRDRVAVLAFRGQAAELLLPPTRSLARAKRSLAALPGGGGTPLAAGIGAAGELAAQIVRQGQTPVVVLLTDGRANIARDGTPGRAQATADALQAARQFRGAGLACLLIDTSPQAQPQAALLAEAMGAAYVPLPYAGAQGLSQAVRLAAPGPAPR